MPEEIKELIEELKDTYGIAMPKQEYFGDIKGIEDYITNLQEENERTNRQLKYYTKYRSDTILQKEVYDILELGKDLKNLHKHKNTGGLLWIDLPMTLFSSLTSYIRTRDVMLEDYKSRIEKAVAYITNTEDMCYYGKCNDGDLLIEVEEDFKNDLLNILNGKE